MSVVRNKLSVALLAIGALLLVSIVLAACGSSGGSSSSSAGAETTEEPASESSSAETSEEEAAEEPEASEESEPSGASLEELLERPTQILVTQPIKKAIPSGKSVVMINCSVPACVPVGKSFEESAALMGWKLKMMVTQPLPPAIQSSMSEAIRTKPDAIVLNAVQAEQYPQQLAEAKKQGIYVVELNTPDTAGSSGPDIVLAGGPTSPQIDSFSKVAQYIVAKEGSGLNVGVVELPGFEILAQAGKSFEAELMKACPDCKLTGYELPLASLGKDSASLISSFVQGHPEITVLFSQEDSFLIGVPAALKTAAGRDVHLYGIAPIGPTLEYLRNGEEEASGSYDAVYTGYLTTDTLARQFAGEEINAEEHSHIPVTIWTGETIGEGAEPPPVVEDYKQQFKKLWNK